MEKRRSKTQSYMNMMEQKRKEQQRVEKRRSKMSRLNKPPENFVHSLYVRHAKDRDLFSRDITSAWKSGVSSIFHCPFLLFARLLCTLHFSFFPSLPSMATVGASAMNLLIASQYAFPPCIQVSLCVPPLTQ